MNRILQQTTEPTGVLVNDFGALNIDADLIAHQENGVVALTNGCVCCSLQNDLVTAFEEIRATQVNRVLLEASGVALPGKIVAAATGWFDVAGCFVVVDAVNVQRQLQDKFIKRLIQSQIDQADLLLVSKTDLAPCPERLKSLGKPVSELDSENDCLWLFEPIRVERAVVRDKPDVQFNTQVWQESSPLCPETVRQFLVANSSVIRAKGWFQDKVGQTWQLQAVEGGVQMVIEEDFHASKLVFIYRETDVLDLQTLESDSITE